MSSVLLGDFGGTNCRFALLEYGATEPSNSRSYQVREFASSYDAITEYLRATSATPEHVCFGVAGPPIAGRVDFTNNDWNISKAALREQFSFDQVVLLNDFELLASAIPYLTPQDIAPIGNLPPPDLSGEDFNVGVIGPGTGLGTAAIARRDGTDITMGGEGGHSGLVAQSGLQRQLLPILEKNHGRVTREHLVSGPGLVNIYSAICELQGAEPRFTDPGEIAASAIADPASREGHCFQLFLDTLAEVAGEHVLTFRSFDGLFIAGGIVKRYVEQIDAARFRSHFELAGPYLSLLQNTPTCIVTHPDVGLLGASCYAQQLLAR